MRRRFIAWRLGPNLHPRNPPSRPSILFCGWKAVRQPSPRPTPTKFEPEQEGSAKGDKDVVKGSTMPALPGWDSLDSVSRWHGFYEIAGIVCLALLVLAEVLAYQYGHRKDELVALAEATRTTENEEAETRRRNEVSALQKQLSEADKRVAEIQERQAPRRLNEEQKSKLSSFLADKPKGQFSIKANSAVADARAYGDEIATIFRASGWQVLVEDAIIIGSDVSGVWFKMRGPAIPPVAGLIHTAFKFAGVPIRDSASPGGDGMQADEVWLQIGHK